MDVGLRSIEAEFEGAELSDRRLDYRLPKIVLGRGFEDLIKLEEGWNAAKDDL